METEEEVVGRKAIFQACREEWTRRTQLTSTAPTMQGGLREELGDGELTTAGWKILEYLPRRVSRFDPTDRPSFMGWYIPDGEPRDIPDSAAIHPSVFKRRGSDADYAQPNIPHNHVVAEPPQVPKRARRTRAAKPQKVDA